jgi:hypothetical protein
MSDPTPATREHKKIGDELDAVYVDLLNAATYAQSFMTHKHGNPNEVYEAFYTSFINLFMHTRSTREMTKDGKYDSLISAIDRWMQKDVRSYNVRALIREGLWLFKYYQKAVIKSGAVIIKRE